MLSGIASLFVLVLLFLPRPAFAQCPAGSRAFAPTELSPGLPLAWALQANLRGDIVPLGAGKIQNASLADGATARIGCHEIHWGLGGTARLRCAGNKLMVDTLGCISVGCPWHRHSLVVTADPYGLPSRELAVPGVYTGPPKKWSAPVLALDGALYSAPMSSSGVLRVMDNGGTAQVMVLQPSLYISGGLTKFSASVLAPDGYIYCLPFSASQVMRIDPVLFAGGNSSGLQLFGNVGTMNYKWSHAVLAKDGRIYGVPAAHSAVLAIHPDQMSLSLLSIPGNFGGMLQKWVHAVLSPQGDVFGIPGDATSVLRIQPDLQVVTTLGNFGAGSLKWLHALLATNGKIYAIPGAATAILSINPGANPPSIEATLGAGLLDATPGKWSQGVLAADGRIYCIPRAAQQVLVVDPMVESVSLVGPFLGVGLQKWESGLLAPDMSIYGIPSDAQRMLRIVPGPKTTTVEEVDGATLPGVRKYSGAALVPSGAIYATPSYAAEVLSLAPKQGLCLAAPLGKDASCTLGRPCSVDLEASPGWPSALASGSNGSLWVLPFPSLGCSTAEPVLDILGFSNPQLNSTEWIINGSSQRGRRYSLGTGLAGELSRHHHLCWAPFWGSSDVSTLGTFALLGPLQKHQAFCTLGVVCSVVLQGIGLDTNSWLLLGLAGQCSKPGLNVTPASLAGLVNPTTKSAGNNAGSSAKFQLGLPTGGVVGNYQMCWSYAVSPHVPPDIGDFVIRVGSIEIHGPILPSASNSSFHMSCWVSFKCDLVLKGFGLSSSQNRLSFNDRNDGSCDNDTSRVLAIPGLYNPASSVGDATWYDLGLPQEAHANRLQLCWHATVDAVGISYGTLQLYGPVGQGNNIKCRLNSACNFTMAGNAIVGSIGNGFGLENRIKIVKSTSCVGSTEAAPLWGQLGNPAEPEGLALGANVTALFVNLSTPVAAGLPETIAVIGTYSICWSPNGAAGSYSMQVGMLIVEDLPCQAPINIEGSLLPACRSATTRASVTNLRHGEECVPACAAGHTPSLSSLRCHYGLLTPDRFECRRLCLVAREVKNSLGYQHCEGTLHGETCSFNCPANTLASGYFRCIDGAFYLQSNSSRSVFTGEARCYRRCEAVAACKVATLEHGRSCDVVCPSGSNPATRQVTCRDGEVQPSATPKCLLACSSAPAVANAKSLVDCAGAASGTVCWLRCKDGYRPTGDIMCDEGSWTSQRCLAPCPLPQIDNAPNGSLACEGYNEGDSVQDGGVCRPKCNKDFSVELPQDSSELGCLDGVLSPSTFTCRSACMQVPFVDFTDTSRLALCSGTVHGATCELPCRAGYRKTGDLVCSDGTFSEASCIKECSAPPDVENAEAIWGCSNKPPGATCDVTCLAGYSSLPGTGTAVCVDGAWTEVLCEKECSAPVDINLALAPSCHEGYTVHSGGVCSAKCQDGFEASTVSLSCSKGVLNPSMFSCGRSCSSVSIANADRIALGLCTGMRFESVCRLSCSQGYRSTGDLICGLQGWQQHVSFSVVGPESHRVQRGLLLSDSIVTKMSFILKFKVTLREAATRDYQSILHITSTGLSCCSDGDQVPAIFVAPTGVSSSGRRIRVNMDGSDGCMETLPLLELGQQYSVVVSVLQSILMVTFDDKVVCETQVAPGQYGTALAYAGGPRNQPAVADLEQVEYIQAGLSSDLPKCEVVTCSKPLPMVIGAIQQEGSGSSETGVGSTCVGLQFGSTCKDIACPAGSLLAGHFECAGLGTWRPVPAAGNTEVRCIQQLCPERPPEAAPLEREGASVDCNDRTIGSTCPIRCPAGHANQGGFVCGPNAQWMPIDSAVAPSCLALPCQELPELPNALKPLECRGLPSGLICAGQCIPPWKPIFQYRCQAQRWVEVPLCVSEEMLGSSDASARPAVTTTLLLQPSSEIQQRVDSAEAWASSVRHILDVTLTELLVDKVPVVAPLLIHVIGNLSGRAGRRVQAAVIRPTSWQAQFMLALVPADREGAEKELATALAALSAGELADAIIVALPALAKPQSLVIEVSTPSIASLPLLVVAGLASRTGLTMPPVTTSSAPALYIATTPAGAPSILSTDGSTKEKQDESLLSSPVLYALAILPCLFFVACFLIRRLLRAADNHPNHLSEVDEADFKYVIEEIALEDDPMFVVDPELVSDFKRRAESAARRQSLRNSLTSQDLGASSSGKRLASSEKVGKYPGGGESLEDGSPIQESSDDVISDLRHSIQILQVQEESGLSVEELYKHQRAQKRGPAKNAKAVGRKMSRMDSATINTMACCSCACDLSRFLFAKCRRCPCRKRRQAEVAQGQDAEAPGDEIAIEDGEVFEYLDSPGSKRSSPRLPSDHPISETSVGSDGSCFQATSSKGGVLFQEGETDPVIEEQLQRGLSMEQIKAIREFWDFKGSDDMLEDWKPVRPYYRAVRDEKVDTSLAAGYKSDEQAGNIVTCDVTESSDDKNRLELKTLRFAPPTRKVATGITSTDTNRRGQNALEDGPVEESQEDGEEEAEEVGSDAGKDEEAEEREKEGEEDDSEEEGGVELQDSKESANEDFTVTQTDSKLGMSKQSLLNSGVSGTMMEDQSAGVFMELTAMDPLPWQQVKAAIGRARQSNTYKEALSKEAHEDADDENDPRRRQQRKKAGYGTRESPGQAVDMCSVFGLG